MARQHGQKCHRFNTKLKIDRNEFSTSIIQIKSRIDDSLIIFRSPTPPTHGCLCTHLTVGLQKEHTLKRTQLAYRCPAALPPDTSCVQEDDQLTGTEGCVLYIPFQRVHSRGETLSRTELITLPYWFVWEEGLFKIETKLCNNLNFYHLLFIVESLMGGILYFLLFMFGEYYLSFQP